MTATLITPGHYHRPFLVVPYQYKNPGYLRRHVKWLRQDRGCVGRMGVTILAALEAAAATVSILGYPTLKKAQKIRAKLEREERYLAFAYSQTPPSLDLTFEVKSDDYTFNHVSEFALKDEVIWYRRRYEGGKWQPLHFEGWFEGAHPVRIDCDGCNFFAQDNRGVIHYKKVLKEYRREELDVDKERHFCHLESIPHRLTYLAVDKAGKNNWKDKWFSLPGAHHVVNAIKGKKFIVAGNIRSISMSHRGRYNNYVEDRLGEHHPVATGVTTMYGLNKNRRDIHKFDPWSPGWAKTFIPLPETEKTAYEAEAISTSASTIMAIGYEHNRDERVKTLKIITRLADIDTEGWNPGLAYSYFPSEGQKEVRVIPIEEQWREHPLPIEGQAAVTDRITIVQTGEGNGARELRVEGRSPSGVWGIYWKNILEGEWHFEPTPKAPERQEALLPPSQVFAPDEEFVTTVHNFEGSIAKGAEEFPVTLFQFGQRSFHTVFQIEIDGRTFDLALHRRVGWLSFLGFNSYLFELVIPEVYHDDPAINRVFEKRRVFKIGIFPTGDHGAFDLHGPF